MNSNDPPTDYLNVETIVSAMGVVLRLLPSRIPLLADYYNVLLIPSKFDAQTLPEMGVGQLTEDWAIIKDIAGGQSDPVGIYLARVAALLEYLTYVVMNNGSRPAEAVASDKSIEAINLKHLICATDGMVAFLKGLGWDVKPLRKQNYWTFSLERRFDIEHVPEPSLESIERSWNVVSRVAEHSREPRIEDLTHVAVLLEYMSFPDV